MTTPELLSIRLYNQLLTTHSLKEPQEIVSWMGAMQSQSLDLAKWAIGTRLENKTMKDIDEALGCGQVIRTHILRPTWHFVSAEDIHWMFDLSSPRLRPIYQSYARMQQVDEKVIYRMIPRLEKMLQGGKHFTKQEITECFASQGIHLELDVLNQVLQYAEMEGLLVNGALRGKQQTFTLLTELAPRTVTLCKEEALERLARKFFNSHAPASINDFAWWSGLSLTECKQAIGLVKDDFICERINGRDFWMRNDTQTPPVNENSALLLPPFDEFVVSYKDRSELIDKEHYGKVMTKNGLFSPTVMLNGEIIGSWKKATLKGKTKIELSFFEKTAKKTEALFESEIRRIENFY
ncbi:winged helix DNA-binding domain-containing protein [Odoribacter sp. OttesenSCG-928-G04]|nr:winged helix DNA-binding domain-containing protein [Odoribacter sp. OttesenSCG-928-G04]MDL2331276.1 winged helix DNA-binding domain-containing protein [Odoribacter sp. OttesenSCG-928-A06]